MNLKSSEENTDMTPQEFADEIFKLLLPHYDKFSSDISKQTPSATMEIFTLSGSFVLNIKKINIPEMTEEDRLKAESEHMGNTIQALGYDKSMEKTN